MSGPGAGGGSQSFGSWYQEVRKQQEQQEGRYVPSDSLLRPHRLLRLRGVLIRDSLGIP